MSASEFGAFSIAYAVYGILIGLSEGLASVPLTVRYSAVKGERLAAAVRDSVGATLGVGIVFGAGCLAASSLVDTTLRWPLAALGICMPGLLLQDGWRFAFMARGEPARAAANDGAWAVLQLIGIVALAVLGRLGVTTMILVWGGGATGAALFGCAQARARPAFRRTTGWIRDNWDLAPRYALETALHRGGPYLLVFVIGAVAGLEGVAGFRGAMLLLTGPLNLIIVGTGFVAVPEGVRLYDEKPERLPVVVRWLNIAIGGSAALWCGTVLLLAPYIGPDLLGATWKAAEPLLPALAVHVIAIAASNGAAQGLWVLAAADRSVRVQLLGIALLLVAAAAGGAADGAQAAAVGVMVAAILITLMWYQQFHIAYQDAAGKRLSPPVEPAPAVTP